MTTSGTSPVRRELARDAEWLATLLARLMPDEPEPLALLALIRLHLARWDSRVSAEDRLVLLEQQDRSLWDRRAITQAVRLIEYAAAMRRPGPYQVEAAIAAVHCEASDWEHTDWPQVLALYTVLQGMDPSPVVRMNRLVALIYVDGPDVALRELAVLEQSLSRYYLFHATRATLLRQLDRAVDADRADARAIELTGNAAERALVSARRRQIPAIT